MAIINPVIYGSGGLVPYLVVSTEVGALITAVNGDITINVTAKEVETKIKLPKFGNWTVTSTLNGETSNSETITVPEEYPVKPRFTKIYGISRNVGNSSTVWTRTDDAVGKNAVASVGEVAGHSDFDSCYPWSDMKRETFSTGDVMVKIPEFWFERKVTDGVETIRIASRPVDGFMKHPGSGKYVGAYKTSSGNKSIKDAEPTTWQTRATMRTNVKSKGAGWGLIDVTVNSAIQMLYLVEFADNDSQAKIGYGYCSDNRININTGSCDSVPNLTGRPSGTDGKVDVVYRGIEGIWGNVCEWIDGLNYSGDTYSYYVCTDPSMYADDTLTGYTKVSFTSPTTSAYISKEGMDNALPWVMLPSEATNGSENTFYPDFFYQASGLCAVSRSGIRDGSSKCGVWCLVCDNPSAVSHTNIGSRLLYDPS